MTDPTFLEPGRLLSVQSHVVSGYVGNRAATFPLQLLGWDVDVINTVQFSNHTGYGHTNGHKTTADDLTNVFKGLERNGLSRWSRVLTGYIPGAAALQVVGDEVKKLQSRAKEEGEEVLYLLDPVMGDIGKGLYVAAEVVEVYRGLLSQATIITPNQFETELLSQQKITTLSTLFSSLQTLHHPPNSVPHVIISSIPLPISLVRALGLPGLPGGYRGLIPEEAGRGSGSGSGREDKGFREKITQGVKIGRGSGLPGSTIAGTGTAIAGTGSGSGSVDAQEEEQEEESVLVCFASSSVEGEEYPETYAFALPTIMGYYSGVGDLFSALVVGLFEKDKDKGTSTTATATSSTSTPTGSAVDEAGRKEAEDEAEKEKEEEEGQEQLSPLAKAVSLALMGVQQVLLKTHLSTLRQTGTGKQPIASSSKATANATPSPSRQYPLPPTPTTTLHPSSPHPDLDPTESCIPSDEELDSRPPSPSHSGRSTLPKPSRVAKRMRMRELKLIEEREVILALGREGAEGWRGRRVGWGELLKGTGAGAGGEGN